MLEKIKFLYKLKEVDRYGEVGSRKESTAEHTYSAIILAQHLLKLNKNNLDYEKVTKIILYHDLVEIIAGDVFILDEEGRKDKKENELKALEELKNKVPDNLRDEIASLWLEYEDKNSLEAKFAHAVDVLDEMIQSIDRPDLWKKYDFTEAKIRDKKEKDAHVFPETKALFEEIISFGIENNLFAK